MFLKRFFVLLGVLVFSMSLMAQSNPADLDTSFGTNGKIVTDFDGGFDMITAIELLPEGKILASGIATNAITLRDFGMIRYHANGNVDTSFGTNGKVKVDFNGGDDRTNAMAVLSDGKILLAGGKSQGTWGTFGIAKFNSNGTLDTTFGTEGKVSTGFSEFSAVNCEAFCMSVLSDGKFLLAGVVNKASWDFAIAKYNADGSLDTTFGTGGKVVTDFNGQADYGLCMIVLEDGKILVGGSVYNAANTNSDFALARYNANGTLDSTFGTNGKVTTDFPYSGNDGIESLAVLADGKIIAAGNASPYNGSFAIACYHANGALDTTFGTNGQVTTDFNPASLDAIVKIKVFPDGKILAGGYANSGTNIDFALARYNADGSMDSRFGTGGKVTTDFATIDDRIVAVAIQPDGKIVAAGKSDTNFALARYMGDSKLISLQIGALPKDQGGLSEYLLKLPFGTTPQDVRVHLEWDDSTGALLRLKRQWPAARGEKDRETRGLKTLDVVYKNVSGNFDLVIKHQPAVGTNPGSAGHARNIVVSIYCASLPTSLTLTPWIGDPGIGGLPFVHKLSLYAAPTHFTSEYPTGANVTEQINTTPTWEWIMNDSTASFLTYPAEIKVDWE